MTKKPALDNLVKRTSNSQLIVRSGEDVDKSLREKQAQNQGSSITDQRLSPPGALSHLRRSPIMSTNIRARPQSEVITSPLSDRYREKRPNSQILLDQEISIDGNSNKNYKPREAKIPPDRNFTLSSQKLSSNYQRQQPTGEIISESHRLKENKPSNISISNSTKSEVSNLAPSKTNAPSRSRTPSPHRNSFSATIQTSDTGSSGRNSPMIPRVSSHSNGSALAAPSMTKSKSKEMLSSAVCTASKDRAVLPRPLSYSKPKSQPSSPPEVTMKVTVQATILPETRSIDSNRRPSEPILSETSKKQTRVSPLAQKQVLDDEPSASNAFGSYPSSIGSMSRDSSVSSFNDLLSSSLNDGRCRTPEHDVNLNKQNSDEGSPCPGRKSSNMSIDSSKDSAKNFTFEVSSSTYPDQVSCSGSEDSKSVSSLGSLASTDEVQIHSPKLKLEPPDEDTSSNLRSKSENDVLGSLSRNKQDVENSGESCPAGLEGDAKLVRFFSSIFWTLMEVLINYL